MGYDQDFYDAYEAFLKESTVRQAHDQMFKVASLNPNFKNVIDFGCGVFNEFLIYTKPDVYVGIDTNVSVKNSDRVLIQADYRTVSDLSAILKNQSPAAFVSLFSTEITAPTKENYKLYEKIFREIPSINYGLVSGFFYTSRKDENPIVETGGVVSYQTTECIETVQSNLFTEYRIILPVPSKMFGKDVYEVWKFFKRK